MGVEVDFEQEITEGTEETEISMEFNSVSSVSSC
jgi:hypothetical protein